MASLVLGPLLRHSGERDAIVWVETDRACTVEVLGFEQESFEVEGHHYALVQVTGLAPASTTPYEVVLDGTRAWPEPGSPFPASVIRTSAPGAPVEVVFGSCRVADPHEPPWTLSKDEHPRGRGRDALRALARRMAEQRPEEWPDLLLMLGDQIYADEVAPNTREWIRRRRDPSIPPGETLADFQEYARLYREAWGEPWTRWLLSTLPSGMIFDDHDIHDDWNTSDAWVRAMRARAWWDERIIGGFSSYWIYQHLGNLEPERLAGDDLYARVRSERDAAPVLREWAWRADRSVETAMWSFKRDLGPVRMIMIDSRAGRLLDPGNRAMTDAREWELISRGAGGPHRHLLLATSLPWLLAPGMHALEAWNEAVCDGAWGRPAAWAGEKLRQGFDLEHWAAFGRSFERFCALVQQVGSGGNGEAPATITAVSGDVHHSYLAEVAFRRGAGVRSRVHQAVCSPFRNPLDARERRAIRFATGHGGRVLGATLARAARVAPPPVRWRFAHRAPWFHNMLATIAFDGDGARLRFDRVGAGDGLIAVYARDL